MDKPPDNNPPPNASESAHSNLQIQELAQAAKEQLSALVAPTRMHTAAAAGGTTLCKTCNAIVRPGANYCQNCGVKVVPSS